MQEHDQAATEEDDRNIAELLLDQIEFADVILLNKKDLVPDRKARDAILATVKALNPQAQVQFTINCEVGAGWGRSQCWERAILRQCWGDNVGTMLGGQCWERAIGSVLLCMLLHAADNPSPYTQGFSQQFDHALKLHSLPFD